HARFHAPPPRSRRIAPGCVHVVLGPAPSGRPSSFSVLRQSTRSASRRRWNRRLRVAWLRSSSEPAPSRRRRIEGDPMRRLTLLLLAALATSFGFAQDPVTIGSKIDTEGSVLAQIVRLVLEDAGIAVEDRSGFGTTSVVREALLAGEIDLYPEYTG